MTIWSRKILFVTGKGGVGKTLCTAILGMAAASQGVKTAIVELNGQHDLARLFGYQNSQFAPRMLAPHLALIGLTPIECLHDFGRQKLRSKALVKILLENRVFDALVDGVDGLHDLFQLGKINNMVKPDRGTPEFELVIVDAPATGHARTLFSASAGMRDMTRVGIVAEEAGTIADTLANPEMAGTILVTHPEALPTSETLEFIASWEPEHPQVAGLLINQADTSDQLPAGDWKMIRNELMQSGFEQVARVGDSWQNRLIRQQHAMEKLQSSLQKDLLMSSIPKVGAKEFSIPFFRRLANALGNQWGSA